MAIKHATIKAPGNTLAAVADWNADHIIDGDVDLGSNNLTTTGNIEAAALITTVETGTAPMTITSTTKVSNLNVDAVDGYHFTGSAGNVTADAAELNKVDGYTGTAANLNTLTDDSMADALHRHSELSASDGTPNPAVSVNASGTVSMPYQSYVRLNKNDTGQVIATGTVTQLTWTVATDTLGEMSENTFTAKNDGVYLATFHLYWDSLTTNNAGLQAVITTSHGSALHYLNGAYLNRSRQAQAVSYITKLSAGDTIKFRVWQNSGGNQTVGGNTEWTGATIAKIA